jgi:hypothetical protein
MNTPRSFHSEEGLARNIAEEEMEEGQSLLYQYSRHTLKNDPNNTEGKLIKYNVDRMMSWPALFQWTGTVVSHGSLWKTCAVYWVISISLAIFFYMCHVMHAPLITNIKIDSDKNLDHLATVTTYITALLGFMIGFFVSISLNRWWSLRDNCIGGMHRAINDMQLFLAIRLTDPSDHLLKDTALRLCLLAHRLVFMEAQEREGPEHLEKLIDVGMLSRQEFVRLQGKHRKRSWCSSGSTPSSTAPSWPAGASTTRPCATWTCTWRSTGRASARSSLTSTRSCRTATCTCSAARCC